MSGGIKPQVAEKFGIVHFVCFFVLFCFFCSLFPLQISFKNSNTASNDSDDDVDDDDDDDDNDNNNKKTNLIWNLSFLSNLTLDGTEGVTHDDGLR